MAASAAADSSGVGEDGAGGRQAEQILRAKKQWWIPARAPRGNEIPIAINSKEAEPDKGKFRRLGLDVAVNAAWLAMKSALAEGNKKAEGVLEILVLDWPFDFHLFEGTEEVVEEMIMNHIINLPAATERLRGFCGLDTGNLMRIAGQVQ